MLQVIGILIIIRNLMIAAYIGHNKQKDVSALRMSAAILGAFASALCVLALL